MHLGALPTQLNNRASLQNSAAKEGPDAGILRSRNKQGRLGWEHLEIKGRQGLLCVHSSVHEGGELFRLLARQTLLHCELASLQ